MESRQEDTGRKGFTRYMVAAFLVCGVTLNSILKVMLSLTIVAMVKQSTSTANSTTTSNTTSDTCPGSLDDSQDTEGPFDWDEQVQGEILSSFFYGYVATQMFGGWTAGRFGGRWVFCMGLALSGIVAVISPSAAELNYGAFMACRTIQGLCAGLVVPSANVLLSKWFTLNERPRIAGLVLSANHLGTTIAMGLSGVIVAALDWTAVFYIYGALAIAFFLPWIYIVHDNPEVHPRISPTEKEYIMNGLRIEQPDEKQEVPPTPWLSILTSIQLWIVISVHVGNSFLNFTLLTLLPTYISNMLHFNIKQSGFISALPYLCGWISAVVCSAISSYLQSRGIVSRMNAYRIFTGIASLGGALFLFIVILLGCETTAIIVCLVATTTLLSAYYGGIITHHMDLAPNFTGVTTGLVYSLLNSTGIISPLISGAILKGQQTITNWNTVFYIAMGVSSIPYINYAIFARNKIQSWNFPKPEKKDKTTQEKI